MRFKAFNARYRLIAPFKQLRRAEEQAVEDTKLILQNAQQLKNKFGASTSWALGKRHIFLSEGIRQQLECLRSETRRKAATVIQVMFKQIFFFFFLLSYTIFKDIYFIDLGYVEGMESSKEMAIKKNDDVCINGYWSEETTTDDDNW